MLVATVGVLCLLRDATGVGLSNKVSSDFVDGWGGMSLSRSSKTKEEIALERAPKGTMDQCLTNRKNAHLQLIMDMFKNSKISRSSTNCGGAGTSASSVCCRLRIFKPCDRLHRVVKNFWDKKRCERTRNFYKGDKQKFLNEFYLVHPQCKYPKVKENTVDFFWELAMERNADLLKNAVKNWESATCSKHGPNFKTVLKNKCGELAHKCHVKDSTQAGRIKYCDYKSPECDKALKCVKDAYSNRFQCMLKSDPKLVENKKCHAERFCTVDGKEQGMLCTGIFNFDQNVRKCYLSRGCDTLKSQTQQDACHSTCRAFEHGLKMEYTEHVMDREQVLQRMIARRLRCLEWIKMQTEGDEDKFYQPPVFCEHSVVEEKTSKSAYQELGSGSLYIKDEWKKVPKPLRSWVKECAAWKIDNFKARKAWQSQLLENNNKPKTTFQPAQNRPRPFDGKHICAAGLKPSFFIDIEDHDYVLHIPTDRERIVDSNGWLHHSNFNAATGTYQTRCKVEDVGFRSMGYKPLSKLCRYLRGGKHWPTADRLTDMNIRFNVKTESGKRIKVEIEFDTETGRYKFYSVILKHTAYTYDNRVQACLPANTFVPGKDVNSDGRGQNSLLEVESRQQVLGSAAVSSGDDEWRNVDGKCDNIGAATVFHGLSSKCDVEQKFDCVSNPALCDCFVWVGDTGTEVTFKRQDSKDSLTFWKKGDYVEYEMSCAGERRRRRLLNGHSKGSC